jgi:hypothetical protein
VCGPRKWPAHTEPCISLKIAAHSTGGSITRLLCWVSIVASRYTRSVFMHRYAPSCRRCCTSLLCCCASITFSSVTCNAGSAGANLSPSSSVSTGAALVAPVCTGAGIISAATSLARPGFLFFECAGVA